MEKHRKLKMKQSKNQRQRKWLWKKLNQILLTVILFLASLIAIKLSPKVKETIYDQVYNKNLKFAVIGDWYQKNFGSLFPIKSTEKAVFQEKLSYSSLHLYKDGVSLEVPKQYMVPVLESGIIVFLGEKENYGNTVIVQQVDGVDVWYGNVDVDNLKLYDYVEKGTLLGQTKNEKLYLVFQKEGSFLDYKEYLS